MTSPPALPPGQRLVARVLALVTALLLVAGGLVTTYRVGMAVTDWPTTFGYSMFAYPLDQMAENWGVTVEHSHRLLGSLVGLLSLVLVLVSAARCGRAVVALAGLAVTLEVLAVFAVLGTGAVGGSRQVLLLSGVAALLLVGLAWRERRAARALAAAIHLAVIGQGLLGGTRVLENSQQLAFLHGSAAQLVFVLVALGVVVTSRGWVSAERLPPHAGRGLVGLALGTTLLVYGQVVLGAWLRHSGQGLALTAHLALALAASGAVLLVARRLRAAADAAGRAGHDASALRRVRRWLLTCLVAQVLLGILGLLAILYVSGGFDQRVTVLEACTATAHVLVGALLLASCAAAALWSGRLLAPARAETRVGASAAALEGGAA